MTHLSIIDKTRPNRQWLDALRMYASVSDPSADALLESFLLRACLRVQEMADRSLLDCTVRLVEDDVQCVVRLYGSVSEIISVTDAAGNPVEWHRVSEHMLHVDATHAVVVYKTTADPGDFDELLPVALQYATALYDGQDAKTLASILSQCL